ncbi:MAG: AraC family transcriptional regulator [Pseudomonadales bacterium]|nr:AraC family transcriptional regulator [Pseudomonadales bacterium]
MNQRLVPATLIPSFLDLAIKNKINVEGIFAKANIDPSVIGDTGTYLSYDEILALFDAAFSSTNDPAFGLHLGESVQYHSLDLVGQLIATSKNLQEALDELFRFKDLVAPFTDFFLEVKGSKAHLGFQMDTSLITRYLNVHHDSVAATILTLGKALTGDRITIEEVHFAHPEPEYLSEYERVFKVPFTFGNVRNELIFPASQLQAPLLTSYPEYHQRVLQLAEEKLHSMEQGQSLSAKVITYINKNLGNGPTGLDDVASHFNMTPRTMQRRLKQEESSFAELRDHCRHNRAIRELADPNVDIDDLSENLGFSDTSNFYHAFKRWEGLSPGVYRKKVLERMGLKSK